MNSLEESRQILSFDEMTKLSNEIDNFYYTDEMTLGVMTRTFNYRLNIFSQFSNPGGRNFRGSVYRVDTKELVALPFFKFFNLDENPFSFSNIVKDWKIKNIYEKVDGSLIYFYKIKDNIVCRTKGSYNSRQAIIAQSFLMHDKNLKDFIEGLIDNSFTPMFELLSPLNEIVVKYDFTDLCFLGARSLKTGEVVFPNYENIDRICNVLTLYPIYDRFNSVQDIVDTCNTEKFERNDILEGYTVLFENNEIVKIKRPQYLDLHAIKSSLVRDTKIVELLFGDKLDDLLAEYKDNSEITDYVNMVVDSVDDTWNKSCKSSLVFYRDNKDLGRKEFALKAKNELENFSFSICMNYYSHGEEADLTRIRESYFSSRKWRESKFFKELGEMNIE